MTGNETAAGSDEWSKWLLHRRHGGDTAFEQQISGHLKRYADRVLDAACLAPGMTLADIGTGEGLIAFNAIDRVGPLLNVILTDISAPMLDHVRALAAQRGVLGQCTLIECAADDLAGIPDASVDVVATRAVLAYVADKPKALREFFRVLKPGGRICLAEPIFYDDAFAACTLKTLVESQAPGTADRFRPLLHRWKAAQFPDTQEKLLANPITNYTERTLFEMASAAGFVPVHLELHMDLTPSDITSWRVFLASSPHPWAPTLDEILARQFNDAERVFFEQVMRPLVERGTATTISRTAYISATKPPN
jgi:arsenite methyltransferase